MDSHWICVESHEEITYLVSVLDDEVQPHDIFKGLKSMLKNHSLEWLHYLLTIHMQNLPCAYNNPS